MYKVIIVTGTPGTGKTTIAKRLVGLLGTDYLDVNELIQEQQLTESYDEQRHCYVIDQELLVKALKEKIRAGKGLLIIDSHLSHELPVDDVVGCVVTRCSLKVLKKRLEDRKYGENKVRENLDAEIFEVCLQEAKEYGHQIVEIDTEKKYSDDELKALVRDFLE